MSQPQDPGSGRTEPGDPYPGVEAPDVDERLAEARLIDAPSLPVWTGRFEAPEDAPTVRLVRPPVPVFEPSEPTEPTEPTVREPPTPQREPQVNKEETPMAAEDPRELARRLAEEAKRRLRDVPAVPETPAAEARPVAERAAPPPARTLSAKEALAAARDAERAAADKPAPTPPAAPARPAAARATPPAPVAAQAPRSATANRAEPVSNAATDYGGVVRQAFPKASPGDGLPVLNVELFTTLWRSHRARAIHDGDYGLAAAASALIDAASRIPEGSLVAGTVAVGGDDWAVWVDLSRGTVLAAARPAAVYLAG